MIRKNLTLCCTLSATTVVAAGLLASSALGDGNTQGTAEGSRVQVVDKSQSAGTQRVTRLDRTRKLTRRAVGQMEGPVFTRVSSETLRDLGLHNLPQPKAEAMQSTNDQTARNRRRGASNNTRGAFLANPTGQQYSIASSAAAAFGPVLFGILDYSDPSSGNPHPGGLDDIFTIGVPNPEDGRGYADLTQPSTPPVDYPVVNESITAYNGPAGTATFRSQRRMSGWDGLFPPGNGFFIDALYPGYAVGGQPVDSTILMIGHENLLAWEPQSRVISANLGLRSDESGGYVLFVGLEDGMAAPFHGPDGVALNPFFSQFFIGGEQVTMDIVANGGPYTDPPCPNDVSPNDGSGSYAGRIGNGAVSIADINTVLTAFNAALGPPRPIADIAPPGGNWTVSIADVNQVLASFNVPCPVYSNNNCANAITVLDGTTEFTNVNATTDGPDHGSSLCDFFGSGNIVRDVWFEYTPTCAPNQTKLVIVDTLGSNWDTKVAVYDAAGGCPTDDTDLLACNDDWAANPLTYRSAAFVEFVADGTTLLIRAGGSPVAVGGDGNTAAPPALPGSPLDGNNGTTGYEGFLTIQCFVQDPDNCVDALELVVDGPLVRFDNQFTTNESPSPPATCGSDGLSNNDGGPQSAGGGSRWYRLTSAVDAQITVDTDHGNDTSAVPDGLYPELYYPVEIHVYCNTCDQPTCVASQANSNGANGGTELTFCAEGGREYLVAIWGPAPSAPNGDVDCCAFYDLEINSAAAGGCTPVQCSAENDLCSEAIDVTSSVTVNGSGGAPIAGDTSFANPALGDDDPELPAGSPTCHWSGEPDLVHHTIWYSFTSAALGAFDTTTITACSSTGSMNDTSFMLFEGSCGSLTEVACGEDECGGPTWYSTLIANNLNDGATYFLCIAASGGTGGVEIPGDLTFTIEQEVSVPPPSCDEDFEGVTWPADPLCTAGANVTLSTGSWHVRQRSFANGTTSVFVGNNGVFPAHVGTAYAGMNFNSGAGTATISCWLISPTLIMNTGNEVTFWTRCPTASTFPDRLEVRLSTSGASVDVGAAPNNATGATQVGVYTTVLTTVNPGLASGGYPETWTEITGVIPAVGVNTQGRIALRYFVTTGGPTGANSDYIGIDCWSWDGTFAP
jgi:hypothetical protein